MSHTLDLTNIKKIWGYKEGSDGDDVYMKQPQQQPFTICVEGNIGSGKTTLLNYFNKTQTTSMSILSEPVELWRNCRGVNLLENFYKDPYRWAMPFQTYVILTMEQNHMKKINKPIKFMERSIFSSNICFIKTLKTFDTIDQGMHNIFNEWYDMYKSKIKVDLFVYLKTDPELCFKRIHERNRTEEQSTITLDYLNALHKEHECWLNNYDNDNVVDNINKKNDDDNNATKKKNVYKINGNLNKNEILLEYERLETYIMSITKLNSTDNSNKLTELDDKLDDM